VCGIYGGGKSNKFECLNVNSTLESCEYLPLLFICCCCLYMFSLFSKGGGCVIPSPFQLVDDQTLGRDCSKIDGVEDVRCLLGQCVVRRCSDGWDISSEGDDCVKTNNRHDSVLQINSADNYETMQKTTSNPSRKNVHRHIAGLRHRSSDSLDTLDFDSDSDLFDSELKTSCTGLLGCAALDDDDLTANNL
jgi:hypothetical protein